MLGDQTYNYTIRPMFLLESFRLFIAINFIIVMPIPRRVLQLKPGELVYSISQSTVLTRIEMLQIRQPNLGQS